MLLAQFFFRKITFESFEGPVVQEMGHLGNVISCTLVGIQFSFNCFNLTGGPGHHDDGARGRGHYDRGGRGGVRDR